MKLDIQIYSFLYSFGFGCIFCFVLDFLNKVIIKLKKILKVLLSFLFVMLISILYFYGLLFINNGVYTFTGDWETATLTLGSDTAAKNVYTPTLQNVRTMMSPLTLKNRFIEEKFNTSRRTIGRIVLRKQIATKIIANTRPIHCEATEA